MNDLVPNDIFELKYYLTRTFDIDMLENSAHAIGIFSDDDAKHCLSMALQAKKIEKSLDDSREEIVKPHLDYQKAINKLVKDFKEKLQSIQSHLHRKIHQWVEKQNDNPFVKTDKINVEDGTFYISKKWAYDVIDEHEIPKEYLCVNHKSIQNDISNGIRNIKGVKIYEKEQSNLRIKN